MKFKVGATIPTVQYGNIMPEIEVEAETYEEAYAFAMPKLIEIWNTYVEAGKQLGNGASVPIECFVGGKINYNDLTHTYTGPSGNVYMSSSVYAKKLEKPFDTVAISNAIAKKFNADPKAIMDMWKLKADVSKGFGTAIHAALELYGRYSSLAKAIDKDTALHDHPVIKRAVESFYAGRENEKAEYEPFIVDHAAERATQVDRLLITGDKQCDIEDFKTNAVIEKSLPTYAHQLSFSAAIMEAHGWKVGKLRLHHWNGDWKEYILERKEVK